LYGGDCWLILLFIVLFALFLLKPAYPRYCNPFRHVVGRLIYSMLTLEKLHDFYDDDDREELGAVFLGSHTTAGPDLRRL
jgi:hypothetical protein